MSDSMTTVAQGEIKQFNGGGELAAAAPSQYRSPWTLDSNAQSHKTVFQHGLGVIPATVQVMFSADLETAYSVTWSWDSGYTGNPVCIGMDDQTVFLEVYSGAPLHGIWDSLGGWTTFQHGYWKVVASA